MRHNVVPYASSWHLGDEPIGTAVPPYSAWNVLERFIHDMQGRQTSGSPSRAVLTAIAEALGAEMALVYTVVEPFFACRHELYGVCQRGLGQSVHDAVQRADDNPLGRRSRPQPRPRRAPIIAAPAPEGAAVAV